jgi:hypothetical protein
MNKVIVKQKANELKVTKVEQDAMERRLIRAWHRSIEGVPEEN